MAPRERRRILVVDDDMTILNLLAEHLISLGYDASTCGDAKQALIQAEVLKPDIVITDINMPYWGSGIDAYGKIRQNRHLKDIPVIFITSNDPKTARAMMPPDPKVRLFFKPVDLDALAQAVEGLSSVASAPAPAPMPGSHPLGSRQAGLPAGQERRILIVDDDDAVCDALREALRREGYVVAIANDGYSGVQRAVAELPSLILLDLQMPAGGGGFVSEALASNIRTAPIPILCITSLGQDEIRGHLKPGSMVRGVFSKPLDFDALLRTVAGVLAGGDGPAPAAPGSAGSLVGQAGSSAQEAAGFPGPPAAGGLPPVIRLAPSVTRAAAFVLDGALFAGGHFTTLLALFPSCPVLVNPYAGRSVVAWILLYWGYQAVFSSGGRRSLGTWSFGLRVIDYDGGPLTLSAAAARSSCQLASAPLLLGFIWALFDRKRRCWHDMAVGSLVILD